ncbi:hypothetical protein ACHWQZ_G008223 [Mnemiopsis leidyi]
MSHSERSSGRPGLPTTGRRYQRRTIGNRAANVQKGATTTQRKSVITGDVVKDLMKATKASRDIKRQQIDARHRWFFDKIADYCQLAPDVVEDQILDSDFTLFDNFFKENGSRVLLVFRMPENADGKEKKGSQKLIVTSGEDIRLVGSCIYFFRISNEKELIDKFMDRDVYFGTIEAPDGDLLTAVRTMLDSLVIPSLLKNTDWGKLSNNGSNAIVSNFITGLEDFSKLLESAKANLSETFISSVKLNMPDDLPIQGLTTPQQYQNTAGNFDLVTQLEGIVASWCKQIEQVLAQSEQMRKEADDTGPNSELVYWKERMASFNALLDQIKSQPCKTTIGILFAAKSKIIKHWKTLDARITDAANEAKDNVKYLYTLMKFCKPLKRCSPVEMLDCIPGLINAIRMINSISRYYNTSERMTSLFVKVTNQMVSACKNYILKDVSKVWELPRDQALQRIEDCLHLNTEYQACFRRTKEKLKESPNDKQFDFSEKYIFGKFEIFSRRLEKVKDMLLTMDRFSILAISKIEGMDAHNKQWTSVVGMAKKKNYDILDHRRQEFEVDYDDFLRAVELLQSKLQKHMETCVDRQTSTWKSLLMLKKFEDMPQLQLDLEEKWFKCLISYGKDLENIRKQYQKLKDNPPIPRNMPPISGRIAWARQLYEVIDKPMQLLGTQKHIVNTAEGRKIVKNFNRMAAVLVEFEVLYHQGWTQAVEKAITGLKSSLLVEHPETKKLYVNMDPHVWELLRETRIMILMELEVPNAAKSLRVNIYTMKHNWTRLESILADYDSLIKQIPKIFLRAMGPIISRVDEAIKPGKSIMSWTSMNLDSYTKNIYVELNNLEKVMRRVRDMHDVQLESVLASISASPLVEIPQDDVYAVDEFLDMFERETKAKCTKLARQMELIEISLHDIITYLKQNYNEYELVGLSDQYKCLRPEGKNQTRCTECLPCCIFNVVQYFHSRSTEALVKCTRNSLDAIRRRFIISTANQFMKSSRDQVQEPKPPLFKADICLAIPQTVMKPSLDDVQGCLNKAVQMLLQACQTIKDWGKPDPEDGRHKVFWKAISEHKDIQKVVIILNTIVNSTIVEVNAALSSFSNYNYLWKDNKDEELKAFLKIDPTLSEFEAKIGYYEKEGAEIIGMTSDKQVGAILMKSEPLRVALKAECDNWKNVYATCLNQRVKNDMNDLIEFINEMSKKLGRNISDLDDVRNAMSALSKMREAEIKVDMTIGPVEEAYAMLSRHDCHVMREEVENVDTLQYRWTKVLSQSHKVQNHLLSIQPNFRKDLVNNITVYRDAVDDFIGDYDGKGPMELGITPQEASERVSIFQVKFDDMWQKYETYSGGEELFGLPVTEYPELHKTKRELTLLQKLYGLYNDVINTVNGYYDINWHEVDIEQIMTELVDFQNKCRKLPKGLKDWEAFLDLKKKIDDFNECCPLLEMMANKAMEKRHWTRIEDLTSYKFDIESETFQLRDIMKAPLLKYKEDIEDICVAAVKERDIEGKLKQVIAEWSTQEFSFGSFKTRGELLLKGNETAEIVSLMEDSLMILGSLLSNRYNAPFKANIQKWVANLTGTTEIIEQWLLVQNLWIYLEAVFVGGDIAKQLPQEAKRFANIDKSWAKIMAYAHENPNVVQCCVGDEMLAQLLPHLLEQLEICQKSLTGYLEKKRLLFPRFFFVSDPALLEILGQASDSHTIQNHLLSVFDNIRYVTFDEKVYDKILEIISQEGETVDLVTTVMAQGNVETWLGALLKSAQECVHFVIRTASMALQDPNFKLVEFLFNYQAQVGLLGLQMLWTKEAEVAMSQARSDKKIMATTDQKFLDMLNQLIEVTTRELTKMERTKFETYITIHVHQRDIFHELVQMHVKSVNDFEWTKQSRFYFDEDNDVCQISITNVDFSYQNEFLGCTDRLVITPLTDRCYISIAQALHMSLGAAPAGPAGTGKTESVKDMGRCLGKFVVVFNCSDQMDFRGLGRIYKGLAQSGCWGCFDEFNRVELPVLSVAAQQIAVVLSCKKERKKEFIFTDGDVVSLDPEFGLFLTMNPGYAGRQELPENLKINFRTVAMMVPDREIIMRVKLASVGFMTNVVLAGKFFTLYKLCEEQLSKQVHYDFGLRNILSVLRTMGAFMRSNKEMSEDSIMMKVMRDMNLSKLVDEDEPLFLSLIDDLFPSLVLPTVGYPELEACIAEKVSDMGLVNHPPWNLKVIQLYETQRVRHGMMTLGPSGAGKTMCIYALMKSMTQMGQPHREMRMNPKAITAPQMFGRLDVSTNDWTDGIFSTLWRKTLKIKKSEFVWLILDGPVDAIWIENLNSVLDDNKTLTLANGDRIPMSPNAKIIFEVHNIDNASPATVSRNGMVFMSASVLNYDPITSAWLSKLPPMQADVFKSLINHCFEDTYQYYEISLKPKMEILECILVAQFISIINGLLPPADAAKQPSNAHLERLYVFALMWSMGAILELEDRVKFQAFLEEKGGLSLPKCDSDTTIFEYYVTDDGEWAHWNVKVMEYAYPQDSVPRYDSILVPNVDNTCTEFLLDTISKQGKGVLLIGESGTAKTVIVKAYCGKYDPDMHLYKAMNFSSATTPGLFQGAIESYVDKRMGSTYGPPAGKKMTVFIDDVNMPVINEWGDQITNEIVRQLMENKGFYNLDKPGDYTSIADVQVVAAMIHPGGGRNDIPERLKRQFCVFNCTLPSDNSMDLIFKTIAGGYFTESRNFVPEVGKISKKLVPTTRKLWQSVKKKLLPTPAKFHYIFNLRDLSRIWKGMLKVTSDIIDSADKTLALWYGEVNRVIGDRFTNQKDCDWLHSACVEVINEEIGPEFGGKLHKDIIFADFMREPPEPTGEEPDDAEFEAPKIYEQVDVKEELPAKLRSYQEMYNETVRGAGMDLVFFKDAAIHLTRISRILSMPIGHAMLVGVGGSGKQSLTRLASYIAGYEIFQITLSRTYNAQNLLDDLKILYRIAGLKGKGVTFIFTDNEIKDENFLESMNNLIASGEISGMFQRDEIDEILGELGPVMKKEMPRHPPTNENLYEYFINRVKENLHVVLCFSPVGEKFRTRSLKFPGLFSGCTMDWFMRWPKDALIEVSNHFLSSYKMDTPEDVKLSIINSMGVIQDGVAETCIEYFNRYRRQTHVTPKSYLSFLDGFKIIYTEKYDEIKILASRMETGLAKLLEASQSVAELSEMLVVKEKDLAVASKEADVVLQEVTVSATAAEKVKAAVQKVKDKAQAIVDEISKDKSIASTKLAAAEPALLEAERALSTIKAADIATVRKLGKPPHLIMRIMDCVLLLFQKPLSKILMDADKPGFIVTSWGDALKLMGDTKFLNNLLTFPKDTINDEVVELLEPYLAAEDFNLERAKAVSGNVAGLLSWCRAMSFFFSINKEVLPLKANLAVQEGRLQIANTDLAEAQAQLDEKQKELDLVQAKFDAAVSHKQALMDDAEATRRKMTNATALIEGLAGEKTRWTEAGLRFSDQIKRLVGDALLCTGFLSYSGPFNQEFRDILIKNWKTMCMRNKIPFSEDLDLIKMLVDNATSGEWVLQGLPTDNLSIQNGIIVTKATRYPLLIDPQGQATIWIKKKEGNNELTVSQLNNKYFRTHLEDALSLGRPFLLEDVEEELDPALDNVLEKNFIKQGSTFKVKVGDKECDVMKGFRMYITTKLPNPVYTPEISARTSIIDFTVTQKGLEDQLLGRVILTEKAELESERNKLMEEVNANKKRMQDLEDNLLKRLTETQGSLVEDEDLIVVLQVTKKTAQDVSEKLSIAAETEIKINTAREEYRPVATRGSILYFLIVSMSMVNNMYQTSLRQFLIEFDLSLARSDKSPITAKRIKFIISYLTFAVFKYTVRGLYEEDRFLFTLLLALNIDLNSGRLRMEEFQTFFKGGAALDLNSVEPKPKKWIMDMTWLNLVQLSKLTRFSQIMGQVTRNDKAWKAWFDTDAPEENDIPDYKFNADEAFSKLLLIRSWCPDRIIPQARHYVNASVGKKFTEAVILNYPILYEESNARCPLICFLSMGSDPTESIKNFAKKKKTECRDISMGQGQEVPSRRILAQSFQDGCWVLLQNCHLGLAFMDEVLETVLTAESINPNFRLWMTTEPHPKFPINFLQHSIKFTNEPPQGIKAGLSRTYNNITQEQLDISGTSQWKPMLYDLAFLHTTVQERRKFGPLGWNIPYEFNQSDLNASLQCVQTHLDDMDPKRGVSWVCIRYMIAEVQYGGRVTDDFDKILLNTYCRTWMGEHIFQNNFCFYKGYKIPNFAKVDDYLNYINDELPEVDTPEAFGLHPNADITYQTNTANTVLEKIINIQPKDAGAGGGETREELVYRLSEEMLEKVPENFVSHEVRARLMKYGVFQPMNIFLRQEIDRIQRVITIVKQTLKDLKLAIDGTIIMSDALKDALDNIFDARVPKSWAKVSWDSSTLGFWFTELLERDLQFKTWIFEARPNVFWLTGFFNPQGFLTAMRQEITRAHKGWALDVVKLFNEMTKMNKEDVSSSPQDGVYIYGLSLDGAGWDKRGMRLIEPSPKVLFTPLPVVHMFALNELSKEQKSQRVYECPVYKKPQRTDLTYITNIRLKTNQSPDYWTLRGAALLCDIK